MAIEGGRVLKERYRLIRPLGQGSQASVWVAEHLALSTQVAVKLIDPDLAKKEDARERFKREATAAAQLRSAHVVQILDHGIDHEQPFIVMELLEGEDLFERLNKRGRLTLKETSRIVTQVARALTRAHQAGIVHRDLKPENVFIVPNEDDEVAKVLDFGVAKVVDPSRATMKKTGVGTLIGTPHYMSAEQVKGIAEVDHRSDLWSLGVIAFQCVTGEMPFDSTGVGDLLIKISVGEIPVPSKTLPGLPPGFDAWFAKACERDLAKRFQTAREAAVALATLVASLDTVRGSSMRPPRGTRPPPGPETPALDAPIAEAPVSVAELPAEDLIEDIPPPPPSALSGVRIDPEIDADWDVPSMVSRRVAVQAGERAVIPMAPKSAPEVRLASEDGTAPIPLQSRRVPSAPGHPAAGAVASSPQVARVPSSERMAPSTVSGISRLTDPPPELDGTRRRRMGRWLALALIAGAGVLVWQVVRSQILPEPGAQPAASAPSPREIETAVMVSAPAPSMSAVDPGHHTRPVKPTPSIATPPTARPVNHTMPRNRPGDDSIVIPDP